MFVEWIDDLVVLGGESQRFGVFVSIGATFVSTAVRNLIS